MPYATWMNYTFEYIKKEHKDKENNYLKSCKCTLYRFLILTDLVPIFITNFNMFIMNFIKSITMVIMTFILNIIMAIMFFIINVIMVMTGTSIMQ